MQTSIITMDKARAKELYQQYKKHQHWSDPMDREAQRIYQLIAQGKTIISVAESIKAAGVDETGHPKLAIASAVTKDVYCTIRSDGSCFFSSREWSSGRENHTKRFDLPAGSFPSNLNKRAQRARAILPAIPIHLKPKRGLANYHVLWEAEWTPVPVRDPYLLRRVGKADAWLVVAAWELTPVEQAVMAGRLLRN